ncbi:MAG: hypothetical protein IJZ07_08415 [Clostridia bacterium]|nr:hypothetical protein [Clostridia bacterium]
MKDPKLLSEWEFKLKVVDWLLKYDIAFFRFPGFTRDDYADMYRLPDFDYVHTISMIDSDGDLMTMLKGEMHLKSSQSRSFNEEKLVFFHVLKTFIDSPEVEPFPMGYIILD